MAHADIVMRAAEKTAQMIDGVRSVEEARNDADRTAIAQLRQHAAQWRFFANSIKTELTEKGEL